MGLTWNPNASGMPDSTLVDEFLGYLARQINVEPINTGDMMVHPVSFHSSLLGARCGRATVSIKHKVQTFASNQFILSKSRASHNLNENLTCE